jgi:DNA (cytosine-5)-methyltransferase 1
LLINKPKIENKMNELHLFAGVGGGILGGILLGHRTVCAVELEPYCRKVLLQRQRDGILPKFPIWDDICTFDGTPWKGKVDIVCGGFPCQDISAAGKGAGITGERSGLWSEMARIISEIRPQYIFVENSPMLTLRGLGRVLGDISKMGYDARWGVVGASNVGAPHRRERIWIVAYPSDKRLWSCRRGNGWESDEENRSWCNKQTGGRADVEFTTFGKPQDLEKEMGNSQSSRFSSCFDGQRQKQFGGASCGSSQWWKIEPELGRVANGVADRVDRLKAIGNGQVSAVAATAWRILGGK